MSNPLDRREITSPLNAFSDALLVAADFDGTVYDTFEQDSAAGIYGVDEAYRIAIERVFDFDRDALKRYESDGEHRNRTPSEIVDSLAPRSSIDGRDRLTVALNVSKLGVLQQQIGKPLSDGESWPRPLPGFVDCWNTISNARSNGPLIDRAFISAGHASFIRKCLEKSGLEYADYMITDETIRGLNSQQPPEQLAKPTVMPLMLTKIQWVNTYGAWTTVDLNSNAVNSRITFLGDDPIKDGGLAKNGSINFIHVERGQTDGGWYELKRRLDLGMTATRESAKV